MLRNNKLSNIEEENVESSELLKMTLFIKKEEGFLIKERCRIKCNTYVIKKIDHFHILYKYTYIYFYDLVI